MRDPTALEVETRPSRILLIGGGGIHLLAGVAAAVSGLPLWVKAGLITGIALALVRFVWRYGCQQGRGFIAQVELLDGRWRLETGDGARHHARLIDGYGHLRLVILNFRLDNGQRRSLTLLPDSAAPDELRALRVWLRTRRDADEPDR